VLQNNSQPAAANLKAEKHTTVDTGKYDLVDAKRIWFW
jgi:hypothetical protein